MIRTSHVSRSLWSALALVIGLGTQAAAQEPFGRYVEDPAAPGNAALQTAVAHYVHPEKPGLEVVLYGVVHVGEADYYEAVQRDLDGYDVVLYEMVKPGPDYVPSDDDRQLGAMQDLMRDLLGLSSQSLIDYTRPNLVHADITLEELQAKLGGESLSPLGALMPAEQLRRLGPFLEQMSAMAKAFLGSDPTMRDQLKARFAQQLGSAATQTFPGKLGEVILHDRNERVMQVLAEQLATREQGRVAIFYGAAHHPDFAERLARLGWSQSSKRWVEAWRIGAGSTTDPAAPDAPAEPSSPSLPPPAPAGRWF